MKELRTEIEIQASPDKAWEVLTDLARYPEWNPLIVQAIGKAEVGAAVDITVISETKKLILHCTVIRMEPNRELCWKYHVFMPGLFRGEHSFIIDPAGPGRIRFVDREIFRGLLVPLQARDIDTNSRRGFEKMDQALKARLEKV